jgi:hypothetical protein
MRVSLVHSRVGGEEVVVAIAIDIPHKNTFSSRKHNREGSIVVCAISVLPLNELQVHGRAEAEPFSATAQCVSPNNPALPAAAAARAKLGYTGDRICPTPEQAGS